MTDVLPTTNHLEPRSWLAAIVESSDDGVVSKTLDGIITSWNKGAERIFGYTAEEIIGKPMTTIFPADRLEEEAHILARISRGERVDHFQTVRVTKDGRLLDISVTISPIRNSNGVIVGASKIARDITPQKQAERELRIAHAAAETARREAEAANKAKDHFLSILSHELRTPLTPVLAAVSLLETVHDLSADDLHEQVAMIRRNIETEARLVDDLLDITRIAQGKIEIHPELLDAHTAIRNVVAMMQSEIDRKLLAVTLALRAPHHHLKADPGRFQQILLNLISNAVKFTPEQREITIKTFEDSAADGSLVIQIQDAGIGIDSATLPRIFKPFEQGEQTVTRQFGGLGLGLSIVRSLTELHGGSISAFSEGVGTGATFTLRFPLAARKESSRPAGGDQPRSETKPADLRVLLVEDHEDTRRMLIRLLTSFGCKVTAAQSAKEASRLSEEQDFDLLVSDIGLPDGSGLDVIRQVRQRQNIPGIALSGFGQDEDLRRSREAGFTEHLIKPINFQTLRDVVLNIRG